MPYTKKITASKEELVQMYKSGMSFREIGDLFGVHDTSIIKVTGKIIDAPKNWRKFPTLRDRLESRIKKIDNGCWEWQGSCGKPGYGHLVHNKKYIDAHRASWLVYRGEIPDGMYVLHKCNNKRCINPDHLELGTQHENMIQFHKAKMLDGMIALVPQLATARKEGDPSISIRKVG